MNDILQCEVSLLDLSSLDLAQEGHDPPQESPAAIYKKVASFFSLRVQSMTDCHNTV